MQDADVFFEVLKLFFILIFGILLILSLTHAQPAPNIEVVNFNVSEGSDWRQGSFINTTLNQTERLVLNRTDLAGGPRPVNLSRYCQSRGEIDYEAYISEVSLGSLSKSTGNDQGYLDATEEIISLEPTASYQLEVVVALEHYSSPVEKARVKAVLDTNADGNLSNDRRYDLGVCGCERDYCSCRVEATIDVPASAAGTTLLRVQSQMEPKSGFPDVCSNYRYGEVEDYTVYVPEIGYYPRGSYQSRTFAVEEPVLWQNVTIKNLSRPDNSAVNLTVVTSSDGFATNNSQQLNNSILSEGTESYQLTELTEPATAVRFLASLRRGSAPSLAGVVITGSEQETINEPPHEPQLIHPTSGANVTVTDPHLNVTVSDPDNETLNVSFYDDRSTLIGNVTNVTNNTAAAIRWNDLEFNTTYWWYVAVTDGNSVTSTATTPYNFTVVDRQPPRWQPRPTDQVQEYGTSFSYDLNASDNDRIASYSVNNTSNFTINRTTGYLHNQMPLALTNYSLNLTVNDSYGHTNSTLMLVEVVDTTPPQIEFHSPTTSAGAHDQHYIEANVSASDYHLEFLNISLYREGDLLASNRSTYSLNVTYNNLDYADYLLQATANDSLGNTNSKIREIELRQESSGGGGDGPSSGPTSIGPVTTCEENWTCTDWSSCVNRTQSRNCSDHNQCGSTTDKPKIVRDCCRPQWSCTNWSGCINGTQTRDCHDLNNCSSEWIEQSPVEETECQEPCDPDWRCSAWSQCQDGIQSRTCVDWNQCVNGTKASEEGLPEKTERRNCSVEETKPEAEGEEGQGMGLTGYLVQQGDNILVGIGSLTQDTINFFISLFPS